MIPVLPFSPADLALYAGSALGLLLVPAALGRARGLFVAAFAALGIFLIAEPELPAALQPSRAAAVWFLLSLGPLLLLIPDLFARGRAARVLDAVPTRALLAWGLAHALGVRHVFSALQGDLDPALGLELASGGFLTALGALFLWTFYRPASRWYRLLALFWNAHALLSTVEFAVRLQLAHPAMPVFARPEPGLFSYFSEWPGALEALFWVPVLLCLHAALFYKLLSPRSPASAGTPTPGTPS